MPPTIMPVAGDKAFSKLAVWATFQMQTTVIPSAFPPPPASLPVFLCSSCEAWRSHWCPLRLAEQWGLLSFVPCLSCSAHTWHSPSDHILSERAHNSFQPSVLLDQVSLNFWVSGYLLSQLCECWEITSMHLLSGGCQDQAITLQ